MSRFCFSHILRSARNSSSMESETRLASASLRSRWRRSDSVSESGGRMMRERGSSWEMEGGLRAVSMMESVDRGVDGGSQDVSSIYTHHVSITLSRIGVRSFPWISLLPSIMVRPFFPLKAHPLTDVSQSPSTLLMAKSKCVAPPPLRLILPLTPHRSSSSARQCPKLPRYLPLPPTPQHSAHHFCPSELPRTMCIQLLRRLYLSP